MGYSGEAYFGAIHSRSGPSHICVRGATQGRDRHLPALGGDRPDCLKITIGRDRKAGFNHVDAQSLKFMGQPDFFPEIHRATRGLLAITQSCVKDSYLFAFDDAPPLLFEGEC